VSSARDLAREKRLLKALEDFANTGLTRRDWLVLKRRCPDFLPDEVYELPFDRVMELNDHYADKPQHMDSLQKVSELLVDGITLIPHQIGKEAVFEFSLFPLLLQEQVRKLWRDPLTGTKVILPWRLNFASKGDYALRKALHLEEGREDHISGWNYVGRAGRVPFPPDELDVLQKMMSSFVLEIDWIAGRLTPRYGIEFQEAIYLLLMNSSRIKVCQNSECPSPYFIATRTTQKYCSPDCLRPIQKQSKLRWWNRVGRVQRRLRAVKGRMRKRGL